MINIKSVSEIKKYLCSHNEPVLVIYTRAGCPGCMKFSRLIPLLEEESLTIIAFDCTEGYEESSLLGVSAAPWWQLYENGRKKEEISPTSSDDQLFSFITEIIGSNMSRSVYNMALIEGINYAQKMQDAIAEVMFRSENDEESIISAARLKISKACIEVQDQDLELCVEDQIKRCEKRLKQRMTEKGETPARLTALNKLSKLKQELYESILEQKKDYR